MAVSVAGNGVRTPSVVAPLDVTSYSPAFGPVVTLMTIPRSETPSLKTTPAGNVACNAPARTAISEPCCITSTGRSRSTVTCWTSRHRRFGSMPEPPVNVMSVCAPPAMLLVTRNDLG